MIAITSADYYIAQRIARQLLQQRELQGQGQVRLLARDPSRCEDLKKLGAEVVQVDYQQQDKLQEALQQVQWLVLIPEPDNNRVQGAENLLKIANKIGVKNVVVLSSNAAESQGKKLQEYKQIEQRVQRELQNQNWVILRNDFIQQYFLYLSNWVEEKRQFPLPISEKNKFIPLDVNDLSRAIQQLITRGQNRVQNMDEGMNHQTLTLTGPEALDGPRIVNELKIATGNQEVKYQQVDREQFANYLNQLKEGNSYEWNVQHPQSRLLSGDRPDQQLPAAPNRVEVEDILQFFDWVKQDKDQNVSKDLQKIIGQEGQRVEQFFRNHQDNFKPSA